jgi:hypothetical protein
VNRARIIGDVDAIAGVLQYAPHYHACAIGPSDDGGTHLRVSVDMFVSSREEAEQELPGRIARLCELAGVGFDQEEWVVLHLTQHNHN